jgi:hypothetical protein
MQEDLFADHLTQINFVSGQIHLFRILALFDFMLWEIDEEFPLGEIDVDLALDLLQASAADIMDRGFEVLNLDIDFVGEFEQLD